MRTKFPRLTARRSGLWLLLTTTLLPVGFSFYGVDPFLIFLLSFMSMPLVLLAIGLWVQPGVTRRVLLEKSAFVAICLALMVSVSRTNWPLRIAFHFSEAALNRIADRQEAIRSGRLPVTKGSVVGSERAGFFWVRAMKPNGLGQMCLWLTDSDRDHIGFVRTHSKKEGYPHGVFIRTFLGKHWYFVVED